jgi:hypothetical protein
MGHMVPADQQQPQKPPGQWTHSSSSSHSTSYTPTSSTSRSNGSLAGSLDLYKSSSNVPQLRTAQLRRLLAAAAASANGTGAADLPSVNGFSSSSSSTNSRQHHGGLAVADLNGGGIRSSSSSSSSSSSPPPHALPAMPERSEGAASGQKLAYSNQCGRVHLMNVVVQNVGVDWHLSGGGAWKHQVQRHEACRIILHGRSEFEAYDCRISGNQVSSWG